MPPDVTTTLTDLEHRTKGSDREAELAAGRDGHGELPRSVFNRRVTERKLRLRYPDSPTHPAQAYTAV